MNHADFRACARQNGIYLYAIADKLGISESTMMRMLRKELPKSKKEQIRKIISDLVEERKKYKEDI